MLFLVATNVVASRTPERRPTGTLHARANCKLFAVCWNICYVGELGADSPSSWLAWIRPPR